MCTVLQLNKRSALEDVMPKHVALPSPPKPVVAHQPGVLDIVARFRHRPEQVELEEVFPDLPEKVSPRDFQELRDTSVAYEV